MSGQGKPLKSGDGDNLVFLLSLPRSGSTLLSLMLGSHAEICCPPEPWIVLAVAEYLGLGGVGNTPYGREWAEIAAVEFLLNPERKQRGVLGKAFSMIGNASSLDAVTAARKVLQLSYQVHLDVSEKKVFVDKTPRYYAVLGLIDEIFPQAKKIILLRNPLDVFASYKTTWEVPRTIFTPAGVSVHARDFCEGLFTLADYAAAARDDVLVLRYEDLACDPERALRLACEFAGIDFSPTMLAFYDNTALIEEYRRSPVGDPVSSSQPSPTNNRTVNAWEKRLDRADVQAVIDVLGATVFDRLGYADTIARIRDMSMTFPTEEQAFERRNQLMQSLIDHVHEKPFSAWDNFVLPLKSCIADRAVRLEVIQRQQCELESIRQSFEVSEADRAARLEVIVRQQAELEAVKQCFEVSEADRAARLEVIQRQQVELDGVRQSLDMSEADRVAQLEVIQRQKAALTKAQSFHGFLGYQFSNLKNRFMKVTRNDE